MIISHLKQTYMYFCMSYDKNNNIIIKNILSPEEFYYFDRMDNYDKIHSFNLYLKVRKNILLQDNIDYLKLALLHDSGKISTNFWERTKEVILGKSQISNHPEMAYENLKDINISLAKLCKIHHNKTNIIEMIEFQKLDSL